MDKKLLQDINNVVNDRNTNISEDVSSFSKFSEKRPTQTPQMKQEAERMLSAVKDKFSKLIDRGKYNLVISTLKKLTEETEKNNVDKTEQTRSS